MRMNLIRLPSHRVLGEHIDLIQGGPTIRFSGSQPYPDEFTQGTGYDRPLKRI